MKMRISILFITILILFSTNLSAQISEADSTTSHLQIEKGIALFDEGKYDEALSIYSKVDKSDPNYWWACYETALSYYNLNKLDAALQKCQESGNLNPEDVATIALTGSILDDMGKSAEAIEILRKALSTRPYNRSLLYNLAVSYLNAGDLEKSEETAIRNIRINPYHKNSHLLLAKVNFYMGRITQSYLAYNMAILLNPQVSFINEFEKAISGKLDSLSKPYNYPYPAGYDHRNWDECAWFLKSEMAFNNNFEYDYKINFLTTRQSLMLFRKLLFTPADTSIYSQFYTRFFTELVKNNYTETYFYYTLKNTGNKTVNDWYEKNTSKNDEFVNWAQTAVNNWKVFGFSTRNEADQIKTYHFNDDGKLSSIGTMKNSPDEIKYGQWINVNDDGWIQEKGPYVNNKLEGEWLLYWPNGNVKQKLHFKNDLLDGVVHTFYPNGAKSGIYHFVNGEKEGLHEEYTPSGRILSLISYKDGNLHGKKINYFYDDGYMREADYVAGKIEGKIIEKWLNGAMKSDYNFHDSLIDGPYRTWYSNSKIESEGNYTAGIENGKWVTYFENGSKHSEGAYDAKQNLIGKKTLYYRSGKIEHVDSVYVDDQLNGEQVFYFENGALRSKLVFKNDMPVKLEVFDQNGKNIYSANEVDGELKYRTYYPDGILEMEGLLKENKRHGKWSIYYPLGNIAQELQYNQGDQTGLQKKYHENGNLKEEYYCDSNKINGPYREYFSSGKLKTSGAFRNDNQDGPWITYYSNDSVMMKYYYADNLMAGRKLSYTPDGKLDSEEIYNEQGESVRGMIYDESGKVAQDLNYEYDSVQFALLYPSGKRRLKKDIVDHKASGSVESYLPDGKLLSTKPYVYGLAQGIGKNWDYDGNLSLEVPYTLDKVNGLMKGYRDGKLWYTDTYIADKSEGYYCDYYDNGQVASKVPFTDDQRHGIAKYYAPDSSLMYQFTYFEDVLKSFSYKSATGKLLPEKPVTLQTNQVLCYYPNGKVSARISMKDGLYHGPFITYYPSGKIMQEKNFVKGDLEGQYKYYYTNGKLKEFINYHNDERQGPYEQYYETGQKHVSGQFLAGQSEGEWKIYNQAGKQIHTVYYRNSEIYDFK